MARRPRSPEASTLEDLEQLAEKSAIVAATAATAKPAIVLAQVGEIIDKWRTNGRPFLFENDREVHDFYRSACERILVAMLDCLERSVISVADRIKEATDDPDGGFSIHDLLRVAESMSSQMANLRGLQQTKVSKAVPDNPEDLERRIQELEARRLQRVTHVVK